MKAAEQGHVGFSNELPYKRPTSSRAEAVVAQSNIQKAQAVLSYIFFHVDYSK